MPKKPPKNGFFYFMLSYKKRAESNGKSFPGGMPEVAAAASPEWKTLPQFRKDYFNDLAKEKRNDPRPNVPKRDERRFNSQGKSFAELKMEKAKAEERRNQERDFISNYVHEMNLNDLRDKLMYMIHVNIFCKTDKDVYYPAEIGMVKFSLRGGVKGVFHRYIDPGDIAPGYSFEVKDHSERTHRLTPHFVRSVDATSDFKRLYGEIYKFLSEDEVKTEGTLPPLFTMYDNVFLNSSLDAVKGMFRSLWTHLHPSENPDDNNWDSVFRVFPLPDMFYHLKNRCMAVTNPQTIAFPNDVLARAQLQKDTYHYELDTACKFHRDEDIIAHCSQSFVLRWVYIIRDHCADLIGVDLFPKYVAPKTEIKEEKDEYFDTASVTDSQYSNSWSETSKATSDWGKHEADSYYYERKIKRERDVSPECKVKRDRTAYSPERVKRETDRYSAESRIKEEKDRCSVDRHVKRERDRSSERRVKRERDRYSPDRQLKRERNRSSSADRHMKRERHERDRSYSPDRRMKREKDRSYSPDRRVKREKGRSYSPERRRHRDRSYSPDRRVKREKDHSYSPDRRVKREKDRSYSPERGCRRERDRYPSTERVPKRERDGHRSPEGAVKRERDDAGANKSVLKVEADSVKSENDSEDVLYDGTFKWVKIDDELKEEGVVACTSDSVKVERKASWSLEPIKSEADSSSKLVKPETCEQMAADAMKEENVAKKEEPDVYEVPDPKMETVDLTYLDW